MLRECLVRLLSAGNAHAPFEAAVADLPPARRGATPAGAPHSPWQLVEHLRLAQRDILDFCVDPGYEEPDWPAGHWPPSAAPPDDEAWDASVRSFLADRAALQRLARDPSRDLFAPVREGAATLLEELLLVADHDAYHLGQLVLVRKLLGAWPGE